MTVPERLDILRQHSREVAWHFSAQTLQFVGVRKSSGMKCSIGKDATRQTIVNLALKVQSELRKEDKHGQAKRKAR